MSGYLPDCGSYGAGAMDKKNKKDKKRQFIAEFKTFISRGNVIDMAVGIIVGNAFTAIVNSLVNQVVMPFIGWLIGGINFSDFKFVLEKETETTPEVAVLYGSFFQQIINFLIISFVVFCAVKMINTLHKKKEEAPKPAAPAADIVLLTEIRDLLKQREQIPAEVNQKEESGSVKEVSDSRDETA